MNAGHCLHYMKCCMCGRIFEALPFEHCPGTPQKEKGAAS